jgi:hypothetical protein
MNHHVSTLSERSSTQQRHVLPPAVTAASEITRSDHMVQNCSVMRKQGSPETVELPATTMMNKEELVFRGIKVNSQDI